MLRRLIVMCFGFVIAAGCGAVFLFFAALFDPATRDAGFEAVVAALFALADEALDGDAAGAPIAAFGFVLWAVVMATCVAPLAVAALIGEVAGAGSVIWYAGVSGALAAASPWIARAARGLERAHAATALEERIALLFFLTGTVTGGIYWLIAGRRPPSQSQTPVRPHGP